jgi:hypothetical protein
VGFSQDRSSQTEAQTESIINALRAAQQREDLPAVLSLAQRAKLALGNEAGEPNRPENFRPIPALAKPLSQNEITVAFEPYLQHIVQNKWWRIGDDPRHLVRPLRDTASVVVGCVYAYRAKCAHSEQLMSLAKDAAEYLLWTQKQSNLGMFPFPANRDGKAESFAAAARFLKQAEQIGKLADVEANGWIVADLGDGGLHFDNGTCGVAILELYRLTKDERYLDSAKSAGEWAIQQPAVPNWNYNSFSVFLLAELARETGDMKWRDAAVKKARFGVYPGQLTEGNNKGRWFDGHNARLPYHYILLRSLVSLAACLDEDSPEYRQATDALVLGLKARNEGFVTQGIGNVETPFEVLLLMEQYFPESKDRIGNVHHSEALQALETYCVAQFRAKRPPVAPGVWGRYLNYLRSAK